MGNTPSSSNNTAEKEFENFYDVIDYIATYYILTMDFKSLSKLSEKAYCDKLVVLTSDIIERYFNVNQKCGVISCRIFWGKLLPDNFESNEKPGRVKGFVGCGHVWNMKSWRDIPNYPDWFVFYGEEDFASFHLFKNNWEINYVPEILIQHRVDNKSRKNSKDFRLRMRRSLRSGWYLYFLFYPLKYFYYYKDHEMF